MNNRIIIPVLVTGTLTFDLGIIMPWIMGPVILPILDTVMIVQGGAEGADHRALLMAKAYGIQNRQFDADWDKYGRSAGPKRNERMVVYCRHLMDTYNVPGYCFAFVDKQDRGAADTVRRAEERDMIVEVHEYLPRELYHSGLMHSWEVKLKERAQKLKLI